MRGWEGKRRTEPAGSPGSGWAGLGSGAWPHRGTVEPYPRPHLLPRVISEQTRFTSRKRGTEHGPALRGVTLTRIPKPQCTERGEILVGLPAPGERLGNRGRSHRMLLHGERAHTASGGTCKGGGGMNASVLGPLRSREHQTLCASLEMCTDPPLRVPPSVVPASLDGLELICCLGATPFKAPWEGSFRRGFVKTAFPQPLKMHEEARSAGLGAAALITPINPPSSP